MSQMKALRWVGGALGEVLLTLGLLLALFVAWDLWWTDVPANRVQAATVQTLERQFSHPPQGVLPTVAPKGAPATATPQNVPFGEAFAIVRIPRFGADYARPVLEGTSYDPLTKGVGHYTGTAMPGQVGNFAVAGHRTTYGHPFYNIELLQKGDVIMVETKTSYIVYAVDRYVIVTPNQVEVIDPVPQHPGVQPTEAWMTLTSCNPRYSASQRYVVFAKLAKIIPRANGFPTSIMTLPKGVS